MYWGRHQKYVDTTQKQTIRLYCTQQKLRNSFDIVYERWICKQIIKKSSNFIQETPWHHLTVWHFSTSKNRTNRSPGSFYHGVASFLPSCWSLRLCRLPFCQTQASFYRVFFGACWSIVDGTVSVICFWWWDVALGSLANNILNLYIYSFINTLLISLCMGVNAFLNYININPNWHCRIFRDCRGSLAWNLRYDQPTWEIWLVLQVDSYGPLIMQHRTWQRKIDSGKVFAHKGI